MQNNFNLWQAKQRGNLDEVGQFVIGIVFFFMSGDIN
jgi:hypothetical protein